MKKENNDKAQIVELRKVLTKLCNQIKDEVWGLDDMPELLATYQKAQKLVGVKNED